MRTHQDAVFRLACLLLGDVDEAEDVAQETFIRAWRSLGSFDIQRPIRPWLLRITTNVAHNRRRSWVRYAAAVRRWQRQAPTASNVEEISLRRIESESLWGMVRRLNQADQQILVLRCFMELSVAETAAVLSVPEGTVKSRMNRALDRLRRTMSDARPPKTGGGEQ
jgi:RNA polymerase sigma-70 factor (ECF subfamily)